MRVLDERTDGKHNSIWLERINELRKAGRHSVDVLVACSLRGKPPVSSKFEVCLDGGSKRGETRSKMIVRPRPSLLRIVIVDVTGKLSRAHEPNHASHLVTGDRNDVRCAFNESRFPSHIARGSVF